MSEGKVVEKVEDEVRKGDSTVINEGSPTLITFHKLIGSKLNTIRFFTSAIFWTSPKPTTKRDRSVPNRNINNKKTVMETNNSEAVSHPIFRVCRNRYIFNNCRCILIRSEN